MGVVTSLYKKTLLLQTREGIFTSIQAIESIYWELKVYMVYTTAHHFQQQQQQKDKENVPNIHSWFQQMAKKSQYKQLTMRKICVSSSKSKISFKPNVKTF